MTISSVLTKLFSPSTHAARQIQPHSKEFLDQLSSVLRTVDNKQVRCAAGLHGNEALKARNKLDQAGRNVWHEGSIKTMLKDIRTIERDFAFQAKCAKKEINQAGNWHDQRYKALADLRDKFHKLQHFKPTPSSDGNSKVTQG